MTLAEYLRIRGMTLTAFAGRIDTTVESVRRYRDASRLPEPDVMDRIERATDGFVTPNDFHRARREARVKASAAPPSPEVVG